MTAYNNSASRDFIESKFGLNTDLADISRDISGRKSQYNVATVNSINASLNQTLPMHVKTISSVPVDGTKPIALSNIYRPTGRKSTSPATIVQRLGFNVSQRVRNGNLVKAVLVPVANAHRADSSMASNTRTAEMAKQHSSGRARVGTFARQAMAVEASRQAAQFNISVTSVNKTKPEQLCAVVASPTLKENPT